MPNRFFSLSNTSTGFIDYSDKAPATFQAELQAVLSAYDAANNSAKVTPLVGGFIVATLGGVSTGLSQNNSTNFSYQTAVNCLNILIPIVSTFIVSICNLISSDNEASAKTLIDQGTREGFFNTVPASPGNKERDPNSSISSIPSETNKKDSQALHDLYVDANIQRILRRR